MAATAIFDITHSCLESFDRAVAKHDPALLTHLIRRSEDEAGNHGGPRKASQPPPCDFLGIRNSFLFWIDYTGALSLVDSSLDARLQGLTDISAVVMELLEMVLRSLQRLDTIPEKVKPHASEATTPRPEAADPYLSRWESACRAIEAGLDELHFVALAIRKASAKRLDQMVTASVTEEDVVFRRNVATLVRYRFPAARKGLCQQLGDSIADRRQMILQSKRHAKKLAVRRTTPAQQKPAAKMAQIRPSESGPAMNPNILARVTAAKPSEAITGMTKASIPDRKVLDIRQLQGPRPKALSTVISTISTSQEHSLDYPDLPRAKAEEGESRVQCPYCLAPLEQSGSEKKRTDSWKRHIDEHIRPYACLFPQCAKALTFFTRRREWKAHMETSHSKDWLRKVHTMVWYCDIDHEEPILFDTESSWREHMKDLKSHPGRKLKVPTQAQLDALAPRKQQAAPRDPYVCPLCEQIPQKVQPLVVKGSDNQAELHSQVVDHVADHLKALALMALPSLQGAQNNPEQSAESVELMGEDLKRDVNDGSVVHPPSGLEFVDNQALLLDEQGDETVDELWQAADADEQSWDPEFDGFAPSGPPPEPELISWTVSSLYSGNPHVLSWTDPIISALMLASCGIDDKSRLHSAAARGDVDLIRQLSRLGADLEAHGTDGNTTPLKVAVMAGHLPAVQALIEVGALPDPSSSSYERPVDIAAEQGNLDLVRVLCQHGASLDKRNVEFQGRSALLRAACGGHLEVVELLLGYGANVNSDWEFSEGLSSSGSALVQAAKHGHVDVVSHLLSAGADVRVHDADRNTALSWAAEFTDVVMVEHLLAHGADVTGKNARGHTPLLQALKSGSTEGQIIDVVRKLVDKGADLDVIDLEGKSALHLAAANAHAEIVHFILADEDDGIRTRSLDYQGRTPLHLALRGPRSEADESTLGVVRLLLRHGVDLLAHDKLGYSALMNAAASGRDEAVEELINWGADPNDVSLTGESPLMMAVIYGNSPPEAGTSKQYWASCIIPSLLRYDRDVNMRNDDGDSALALAADIRDAEMATPFWHDMVDSLIGHGADLEILDKNLRTPLYRALSNHSVVSKLLDAGAQVNPTESRARVPLVEAASRGYTEAFMDLLSKGADVHKVDFCSDMTALMGAAQGSHAHLVGILLEQGADVNQSSMAGNTALSAAVCLSELDDAVGSLSGFTQETRDVVMMLIAAGADVNKKRHFSHPEGIVAERARTQKQGSFSSDATSSEQSKPQITTEPCGKCGLPVCQRPFDTEPTCVMHPEPLYNAARAGDPGIVKILLDAGADVHTWSMDLHGNLVTPLMGAALSGSVETVEMILDAGADVDQQWASDFGTTALIEASAFAPLEVIQLLLARGAYPDTTGSEGRTALLAAVERKDDYLVKVLLEGKATPNQTFSDGTTLLMVAVRAGLTSIVLHLLRSGADPRLEDNEGQTARDMAYEDGDSRLGRTLEVWARNAHISDPKKRAQAHLWSAIETGWTYDIRLAMEDGASIQAQDEVGDTALHLAVRNTPQDAKEIVIKDLVWAMAPVDVRNNAGLTPLELAIDVAASGYSPCALRALLLAGLNADEVLNPVQVAVAKGDTEALKALLEQGQDANATTNAAAFGALWLAVNFGDIDMVKMLLSKGANPREEESPYLSLCPAVLYGGEHSVTLARLLLEAGADPDGTVEDIADPVRLIRVFCGRGDVEGVRLLIENGVHPSTGDLVLAIVACEVEVVKLLLETPGVDLHQADSDGWRPLHRATATLKSGSTEIVRMLIEAGSDVNSRVIAPIDGSLGHTALHIAALQGHTEAIGVLFEAGADPDSRTRDGMTALHLCVDNAHVEVARLLCNAGADLDARNDEGHTALYEAVILTDGQMVRLLLGRGAQVHMDDNFFALVSWAAKTGQYDIPAFLFILCSVYPLELSVGTRVFTYLLDNGYDRVRDILRNGDLTDRNGEPYIQHPDLLDRVAKLQAMQRKRDDVPAAKIPIAGQSGSDLHTELMDAIRDNDVAAIKAKLGPGVNVNKTGQDGWSIVTQAVEFERIWLLPSLVSAGAAQNALLGPALSLAIRKDSISMVDGLLEASANPRYENTSVTAAALSRHLEEAVSKNKVEIIKCLLRAGAILDEIDPSLNHIIKGNETEIMYSLIGAGFDVNASRIVPPVLLRSVVSNRPDMVRLFLGAGATRASGQTLEWAARHGHADIALFLDIRGLVDKGHVRYQAILAARHGANGDEVEKLLTGEAEWAADQIHHPGMRAELIRRGNLAPPPADAETERLDQEDQ